MIEETIRKLEQRLNSSPSLNDQNRQELLKLLQELKGEVAELSKTDTEHAHKILSYTSDSTEAATGQQASSDRLDVNLRNLSASVDGFEKSHPQLVQVVNRIAETLSNLGI